MPSFARRWVPSWRSWLAEHGLHDVLQWDIGRKFDGRVVVRVLHLHHVSKGHLHRYRSEFAFRYNNRVALGVNDGERAQKLVRAAEGKRLTYKQPAGSSAA